MYCSIQEAWSNDNTMEAFINKRNNRQIITKDEECPLEDKRSHINRQYTYNNVNDVARNMNVNSKTQEVETEIEPFNSTIDVGSLLATETATEASEAPPEFTCDDFLVHLENCRKCRRKMEKRFCKQKKNIVQILLSDENKEFMTVILIGIFIIMTLDLFVRIGRNVTVR